MSLSRIAIVGRPNVGKSSLLNMIAKAKVSIVDPTPGVTRDRVSVLAEIDHPTGDGPAKLVEVTDTGGFGVYTAEGARYNEVGEDLSTLAPEIERQIGAAVERSDLILFVVDAQAGLTSLDQTIATMLRERALGAGPSRVLVVANKTDGPRWEAHAYEAAALGFGEPAPVSATSNYLRRAFLDRLYATLPAPSEAPRPSEPPAEMRLAIVGKRNAGKSSIVNALAGEERVIVSEIAGTTRDAVDVRFEFDGRSLIAIDTAGLRKRKALASRVEHWAYQRALESVGRADVVFLVLDALEPISRIDQGLTQEIRERFKPCVIIVNKWDLAEGRPNPKGRAVTTEDYRKYIEEELKGLSRAPIVFTSAVDSRGLRDAVNIAFELFQQSRQRVTTGRLNRLFREIIESRGPSSKLGTIAKVLYVAQLDVAPPTIVLVVNKHELFTPEYRRYLLNRIAEATPFTEVPVRLVIRDRKRADLAELLGRTHSGAPGAQAGAKEASADGAASPEGRDFFDESDLDESFK